jgi:DNA-binding beta-propeller fold protein YncE
MSVDTRGRGAARHLLEAAGRLGPPPDLVRLRRRHRRRLAGRAGLATAAAVLAAAVVVQGLGPFGRPTVRPGVPGLDRRIVDAVPVGPAAATKLVAAADAVWVPLDRDAALGDLLVRVDPATDRVVARVPVGPGARAIAAGEGSLWVLRSQADRTDLLQLDPAGNQVARTRRLWTGRAEPTGAVAEHLAVAGGAVWVTGQQGLVRVDPGSGRVRMVLPDSRYSPLYLLTAAGDSLWVASASNVLRVRPSDGALLGKVGFGDQAVLPIDGLAAGAGALWVFGDARTVRVDPGANRAVASLPVGEPFVASGSAPAGAGDHDTMVVRDSRALYLLDPATNRVAAEVPLPGAGAVAVGAGAVWVTDTRGGRLLRVDLEP